jgi:hypothetical protein
MTRLLPLALLSLPLTLAACMDLPAEGANEDGSGFQAEELQPLWFDLSTSLTEGDPGTSADNPLAFSIEGHSFEISVTAMGYDHEPISDFEACLQLHLTSGILEEVSPTGGANGCPAGTLPVSSGTANASVLVSRAYDQLRIWASDEGTANEAGSFASGSTDAIHTRLPTVAQVQASDSTIESPLQHQYVHFLGYDPEIPESHRRELVVTTITNDGFYVTDRSDAPGSFNSMFVFSFSRPDDLLVGDRLSKLAGIVNEFLGFTELQFPTWTVESSGNQIGEPAVLDPSIVCIGSEMEAWESSVVRVDTILTDVTRASDCVDYNEYGQWPALLPGECEGNEARINVVNVNTVPSWKFPECEQGSECLQPNRPDWCFEPRPLDYLVGVLRHTRYASPAWILEVRDCLDFPIEDRPSDCAQLLMLPPSGPRHAPFYQRREAPECTYGTLHR